jgi:hypothetical protein
LYRKPVHHFVLEHRNRLAPVAAGNDGPDAMTIGVPGNVPYVVTVGAMSDNFTRSDPTDDRLASPRSPRLARPTKASSSPTWSLRAATCSA